MCSVTRAEAGVQVWDEYSNSVINMSIAMQCNLAISYISARSIETHARFTIKTRYMYFEIPVYKTYE